MSLSHFIPGVAYSVPLELGVYRQDDTRRDKMPDHSAVERVAKYGATWHLAIQKVCG